MQYLQSIWPLPFLYAISLCIWERCFLYLKLSKSPKNCGKKNHLSTCVHTFESLVCFIYNFLSSFKKVEKFVIRSMLLSLFLNKMVTEMIKCCHLSCHFAVCNLDAGNSLAQVQLVHKPADLWDTTFFTH